MRLTAPLLLTVVLAIGVLEATGPVPPAARPVSVADFTPCLPEVVLGPERLALPGETLVAGATRDLERAGAAGVGLDAGDLWARLTALVRAEAALRAVENPPAGLVDRAAALRTTLLAEQERRARDLHVAVVRADRTADSRAARINRHRLLELFPVPGHPWHGRLKRELGEW